MQWTAEEGAQYAYGLTAQRFRNAWPPRGARTPIFKSRPEHSVHSSALPAAQAVSRRSLSKPCNALGDSRWRDGQKPVPALGCVAALGGEGAVTGRTRNGSRRWLPLMVNEVKRLEK